MNDQPISETAPDGVHQSLWDRFVAMMKSEPEATSDSVVGAPNVRVDAPTPPADQPAITEPTVDAPAAPEPPATPPAGAPGVGSMVVFRSDYGDQYGQVVSNEDLVDGEPACCVAWSTGGVSGPIRASELEAV